MFKSVRLIHVLNSGRDAEKLAFLYNYAVPGGFEIIEFDITKNIDIEAATRRDDTIVEHIRSISKKYKTVVILHALGGKSLLGLKLLEFAEVIPYYYGGEFNHLFQRDSYPAFLPKTQKYICDEKGRLRSVFHSFWDRIRTRYKHFIFSDYRRMVKLLSSVRFIAGPSELEIDQLIKNLSLSSSFVRFPLSSFELNEYPSDFVFNSHKSFDIQLGHSAFTYNNHLDCLDYCKGFDGLMVAPLNYGSERYADFVEVKGNSLIAGNQFRSIRKKLPYSDYKNLIRECRFYLAGQLVQFGLGNIYMHLAYGNNVIMHKNSILNKELSSLGFNFIDFCEGEMFDFGKALSSDQRMNNFHLLRDWISNVSQVQKIRNSIDTIIS